jgi:hypothetical protein
VSKPIDVLAVIDELIDVPVIECQDDQLFVDAAKEARAAVADLIDENLRLRSSLESVSCFASLLVTSVRGHFAYASESSPACCIQACDRVDHFVAKARATGAAIPEEGE